MQACSFMGRGLAPSLGRSVCSGSRFASLAGSARHAGLRSASRHALLASSSFSTSIQYTYTDEAPALATHSLLPIIRRFTDPAGIKVDLVDISVAARILSQFPERLSDEQKVTICNLEIVVVVLGVK